MIPTYELKNIQTAKTGDTIKVSWDAPTDFKVKYYKMYVSENGGYAKYKGKIYHPNNSYTLAGIEEVKTYKFKIKLYYTNAQGSTSIKYFYSDVVSVPRTTPVDTTPPVITVPSDITVETSDLQGKTVSHTVSATDETDGAVAVTCSQKSDVLFGIGSTTVICTASDKAGNTTTKSFIVTVEQKTKELCKRSTDQCPVINTNQKAYGGIPILSYGTFGIDGLDPYADGTLSVIIRNGTDTLALTAGHVVDVWKRFSSINIDNGDTQLHHPVISTTIVNSSKIQTDSNTNTDIAVLLVDETSVNPQINKIKSEDAVYDIIKFGGFEKLLGSTMVQIDGRHSHTTGTIMHSNVTIVLDDGSSLRYVLTEQGSVHDMNIRGGDSGSPISYNYGNNTVNFIGVAVGEGCEFLTHGYQINTTKFDDYGKRLCNVGNSNVFTLFTPWENIAQKLGIQ